jgi:hypothetical protein
MIFQMRIEIFVAAVLLLPFKTTSVLLHDSRDRHYKTYLAVVGSSA